MSSESLDSANQILNAFVNRKVTLDNTSALNAQRLVNQFRQISAFKPEFVAEYNKLLLAASDEELMMMKDIVGGPTVRQYLEFLRKTLNESVDENANTEHQSTSTNIGNDGYLPSPDDELPIFTPVVKHAISNEGNATEASVTQMDLIAQTVKTMQESNQHQITILNETLNTLREQINKDVSGLKETANTSNISIQDFERWQLSQEQFLQKIIKAQNDTFIQFAKTLSEQLATQMTSVIAKPTDTLQSERKHYQIDAESLIQSTDSNNTETTPNIFENTSIDDDMSVISENVPEDITVESSETTDYNFENTSIDDDMSVISENVPEDITFESPEAMEYKVKEAETNMDNSISEMTTELSANEQQNTQFSQNTTDVKIQNINSIPPIPDNIPTFKPTQHKGMPLPPPPFGALPKIPKMFGSIPPIPKGFPKKIASHIADTTDTETDVPATPLNKIDL